MRRPRHDRRGGRREGGAGYLVAALGILGFIAGVIIGLIVARMVAASAHPGFLRALGMIIAGHTVKVAYSSDFGYVAVSLERGGAADTTLVATIGERWNAVLATGKYDSLFGER